MSQAMTKWTIVGTVLQLAMVVAGYFNAGIKEQFALIGTLIAVVTGLLYGRAAKVSWGNGALGGGIAGAVSSLIGIAVSIFLNATPAMVLGLGTVSGLVGGAIGGLIGHAVRGK